MRHCIFCGSTQAKISKEHIWAEWISKLIHPDPMPDQFVVVRETDKAKRINVWDAPAIDVQIRDVCEPCNNGWMSSLEGQAKALLTPMILNGARTAMAVKDQTLVANWAIKTTFTF